MIQGLWIEPKLTMYSNLSQELIRRGKVGTAYIDTSHYLYHLGVF